MKDFTTIKIWRETLPKLKLLAAYCGLSIVHILEKLVSEKLEEVRDDNKRSV